MGTAGSPGDPIFWLHHAQIDRLWGRWLRLGGGRVNPTDTRWLDQQFQFYDASGIKVTQTPADVLSMAALGYGTTTIRHRLPCLSRRSCRSRRRPPSSG